MSSCATVQASGILVANNSCLITRRYGPHHPSTLSAIVRVSEAHRVRGNPVRRTSVVRFYYKSLVHGQARFYRLALNRHFHPAHTHHTLSCCAIQMAKQWEIRRISPFSQQAKTWPSDSSRVKNTSDKHEH